MLFYFTGTGNCLSVARAIEERPVSIPQAIHQMLLTFHSEQLGIVTPIYGHEMPTKVRQFLQKADFRCNYFYLILTYGNRHGGARELAKQFCDDCGISVDYINVLGMVDNWLPAFDMDEQRQIDKMIDEHLSAIKEDIAQHRKMITAVAEEDRAEEKSKCAQPQSKHHADRPHGNQPTVDQRASFLT